MANSIMRKSIRAVSIVVIISFICMDLSYMSTTQAATRGTGADVFLSPPNMSKPIYYDDLDKRGKVAFAVMSLLSHDPEMITNASMEDNVRVDIGDGTVEIFAPESASFDVAQDQQFEDINRIQILKVSSDGEAFLMTIFYRADGTLKFHIAQRDGAGEYLEEMMDSGIGLTFEAKQKLLADVGQDGVESYVGAIDVSVQGVSSFLRHPSVGLISLADSLDRAVNTRGIRFTENDRMYLGKLTLNEKNDKERALDILQDRLSRNGEGRETFAMIADLFSEYWDGYFLKQGSADFDAAKIRPEMSAMLRRMGDTLIQNEGGLPISDSVYYKRFDLSGVSNSGVDIVLDDFREAFETVQRHDVAEHNRLYELGVKKAEEMIEVFTKDKNPDRFKLAENESGTLPLELDMFVGLDREMISILEDAGYDTVRKLMDADVKQLKILPRIGGRIRELWKDGRWERRKAFDDERLEMDARSDEAQRKAEELQQVCKDYFELNYEAYSAGQDLPVSVLWGVDRATVERLKSKKFLTPQSVAALEVEDLISHQDFDIIMVEVGGKDIVARKKPLDEKDMETLPGMDRGKITHDFLSDAIVPTEVGTEKQEFIFNDNALKLLAMVKGKLSGENGEMLLYELFKERYGEENMVTEFEDLKREGAPSLGSIWDGIRFAIAIHNLRGHWPLNEWGFPVLNKNELTAQGIRGGEKHNYGNLMGLAFYLIFLVERTEDVEVRIDTYMSLRPELFFSLTEKQKANFGRHLAILFLHLQGKGRKADPFNPWREPVRVKDSKERTEARIKEKYPNALISNEALVGQEMGDRYNLVFEYIFSQSDDVNASGIAAALSGEGFSLGEIEHVLEELFALGLINKADVGDIYTRGDNTIGADSFSRLPMTSTDKEFVLKTFAGADLSDKAVSADVFGKILENFEGEWARALIKTARSVGEQAKAGEKITHKKLVAIGNGFIRSNPEVKTDLQRLLQIMRELSNDSLEIVMQKEGETPEEFASKIVGMTSREEDAFLAEDILVMVSRENVVIDEYGPIRSGVSKVVGPKKAFFVGVEDAALTDDSYIRITQMLRMAMGIAFNEEQVISQPGVEVEYMFGKDNEKMLIFVPKIVPVKLDNITNIYERQRSIIESA